jgi:hypothetical protein
MSIAGNIKHLVTEGICGPWPCEACGQLSQYADVKRGINHIFCKNERCRYERIIDKRNSRIVENDGTVWQYDSTGNKCRIRMPGQ